MSVRYDGENDWPVIRHADVLLMYAEVLNETDGPATGLPYLNEVRRRAGLAAIAASEVPVRYAFREKLKKNSVWNWHSKTNVGSTSCVGAKQWK